MRDNRLQYDLTKHDRIRVIWSVYQSLAARWRRISLASQFAITSFMIIILGMSVVAVLIANRISESVLRNSAGSAALYMDAFIAPHLRRMMPGQKIDAATSAELDKLLTGNLSTKVVSIKIWGPDGYVLYSSNKSITGKRFPVTPQLKSAWAGNIETELDDLHDEENVMERKFNVPLVEFYSPIWSSDGGGVIAVAEVYERADVLTRDINKARLQAVLAVGALALLLAASVSGIVLKGSRTIENQKITLKQRVDELSRLLKQNEELKERTIDASRRAAETHESVLKRVGAELHDGPTQLVSLALLRLDGLHDMVAKPPAVPNQEQLDNVEIMKTSLHEGLQEIRSICSGLSLPELDSMSLPEVVDLAVRNHRRRSQTMVQLTFDGDRECSIPRAIKIASYRFIQEGLNNSFHHAHGIGQAVSTSCADDSFTIEIRDGGNGFDTELAMLKNGSLGLKGLRDRIESVGGEFLVESEPGEGTRLVARLPKQTENSFNV